MAERLTGLRRSAIVLLSLGQEQAAEILRRLPPDSAYTLRQEMERVGSLREVSLRTRQLVLGQFCAAASKHPPLPTHVAAPTRVAGPPGRPHAADVNDSAMPAGPFAAFHREPARDVLDSIRDEHPQTIALVLAHLPREKASEILAGLEPHRRVEVCKRIAGIEQTSAAVIEQVESSLRARLAGIVGRATRGGPGGGASRGGGGGGGGGGVNAIAEILNAADGQVEDQILSELEVESPDLADQIRRAAGIFEDLMHAGDDDLRAVIEQLDHETIALSLRAVREGLKRRVLWNLPQHQAEQIGRELASMAPVHVGAIERAHQRVAEVVHRLDSAGEISVLDKRLKRPRRRMRIKRTA